MHPADIKAAIEKAGSSQTKIARALKVTKTTVNHVIYGQSSSRRIANEIARVTGKTLAELWPGRYSTPEDTSKR